MVLKLSHAIARLLAWLIAILMIVAALAGWRLLAGPLSLSWLTPSIEAALSADDGSVRVTIGDTELRLGEERTLELVAIDVRGATADGTPVFRLPEIGVHLDVPALLLEGVVAPARVEARAPLLVLVRKADGSIALGEQLAGRPEGAGEGQFDVGLLIADFLNPSGPGERSSRLEELRISGGRLVLDDRQSGRKLEARDANFILERTGADIVGRLVFDVAQEVHAARVRAAARHHVQDGRITFEVAIGALEAAELGEWLPTLPLEGVDLAIDAELSGSVTRTGELGPIDFDVTADGGLVDRPDVFAAILPIETLRLRGHLAPDLEALEVTDLRLASSSAALSGTAKATWRHGQPTLAARLRVRNVAAQDLALFWPPGAAPEAREWVVANITAGVATAGWVNLDFGPGELAQKPVPEHTVSGGFTFAGLTVGYFETMPPVTGVDGAARFTARRMDFAVEGGRVGDLVAEDGAIVITGIGIKGRLATQLEVTTSVSGPVTQAMALIDRPPLEFARELGVRPSATSGRARTDLRIGTPLHRDMDASEVRVAASAVLREAGIAGLREGLDLSDGQFSLKVDNHGADLAGTGRINEVPLEIEWRENFDDGAPFPRRFRLHGTLDEPRLRRLGLEESLPIEGSFGLDAEIIERAAGRDVTLELDLGRLAIDLPTLAWRKPEGEAGRLSAELTLPPEDRVVVERFELSAPGLEAAGRLELHTGPFRLDALALSRLRLDGSEAAITARRDANAVYEVTIDATRLDLNRLLGATGDEEAVPPEPLRLGLEAGQIVFDGQTLREVDADLVRDRKGWQSVGLTARLPAGGHVQTTLVPEAEVRRLRVESDDAGDLFQTLDQTSRVAGGRLVVTAEVRRQFPSLEAEGVLTVDDFTVLDAPLLARLLTAVSTTGIERLWKGEGIHFDRLELPFVVKDRVLTIKKGRMSGSQLGLTVEGDVDLQDERLDLKGTVVPLYGLNWVLGKLPLVGAFLSGEGEGAFAATYTLKGTPDAPDIFVNPLAVLAPGFIRDLFSGIIAGTLEPPTMLPSHDKD